MNALKNLCMMIVLTAIGYGAFVTLTGGKAPEPPPEAALWDQPMHVELPGGLAVPTTSLPAAPGALSQGPPPRYASPPSATIEVPASPAAVAAPPSSPVDGDHVPAYASPAVGSQSPDAVPSAYPKTSSSPPASQALPGASLSQYTSPSPAYPQAAHNFGATAAPPDSAALSATPSGALAAASTPYTASATSASYEATTTTPSAASGSAIPPPAAAAPPTSDAAFLADMGRVQQMLDAGRLADAHLKLSEWFADPLLSAEDEQRLLRLLDQLAGTVVYSREHLLEQPYTVQPGDTLDRVAAIYKVPVDLLAKINGVADAAQLHPGEQLKVLRGPFDCLVDLTRSELTLFLNGRYAGRFPICVGSDQTTPVGDFVVQEKVTNPTYYGREGAIAAGDPRNPLGDRWIDLGNQLGIHGSSAPSGVGSDTRGSIRLSRQDAADVFDILSKGSRVVIRR